MRADDSSTSMAAPTTEGDVFRSIFDGAGVQGYVHAVDLDTGEEVSHGADAVVVSASTFKVSVLVELFRQADARELDLSEQVTVPPEGRAGGPTGLSVMVGPVTLSWRDLALLMMVVSDNAATDFICDRVSLERVNATMRDLGLDATQLPLDCRGIYAQVVADAGVHAMEDVPVAMAPEQLAKMSAADPSRTNATTAREMTRLLALIWDDEVATAQSCAEMRRILAAQVFRHRLASGFPEDDIRISGKTGTILGWHNEVAVVEFGDGGRYAVAVFTQNPAAPAKDYPSDAAIGVAAREAVDRLRGSRG